MGVIRHEESGRRFTLRANTLVGRTAHDGLRIRDAAVSSEHATIWWTAAGWRMRDLGSRNGTLYRGDRIDPGKTVTLAVGDQLVFGRENHAWIVDDISAPGPVPVP